MLQTGHTPVKWRRGFFRVEDKVMEELAAAPPKPRERIISTARDLFRKHGIRGIGVDAIAEVAGTNKMTLYCHFGSKDDLVIACLREVARDVEAMRDGF